MSEQELGNGGVTAAFERMAGATNEFTRAVNGLRRQQRWVLGILGVLVALLALGGVTGWRLYDCTTPGGSCYQDGQRRTGEAVAGLVKSDVLSDVRVGDCVTQSAGDVARFRQCISKAFPVEAPDLYPAGGP